MEPHEPALRDVSSSDDELASTERRMPHFPGVRASGWTSVGRVREINEDRFAALPEIGLFMVADGMGGHAAGEVAAQMAVDMVTDFVAQHLALHPGAGTPAGPDPTGIMVTAVDRAHLRIQSASEEDESCAGMGTTFAGLLIRRRKAHIVHAGDSRVYRLRHGAMEQLTEDHSLDNELRRRGFPDSVILSIPKRGALVRSLGGPRPLLVETRVEDVLEGDLFLLCTDGVCRVLSDGEIERVLLDHEDLGAAVDELIARADLRGGPDNATAVLARVDSVDDEAELTPRRTGEFLRKRREPRED